MALLPYAYALTATLFTGLLIKDVAVIYIAKNASLLLPFSYLKIWGCIAVVCWFPRVAPTLLHPLLPMHDVPASYHHYFPSWEEWAISGGSLAGALLIITFFARVFPVISIYKTLTDENEKATSV